MTNESMEMLTDNEVFDFCHRARMSGYAITAFTPSELRGVDPWHVTDALAVAGNEAIESEVGPEDEDDGDTS